MKFNKKASTISMKKSEWKNIGKKNGWTVEADGSVKRQLSNILNALMGLTETLRFGPDNVEEQAALGKVIEFISGKIAPTLDELPSQ